MGHSNTLILTEGHQRGRFLVRLDSTRLRVEELHGLHLRHCNSQPSTYTLHEDLVRAAKYSPQGDRIATATSSWDSVRVWNNSDSSLLVNIKATVTLAYLKQLDASAGSAISEWTVLGSDRFSCIQVALAHHGQFIAYSTKTIVTF